MTKMQRCAGCRRHVAVHEHECPFCHARLGLVFGTTAAFFVVMSVAQIGCSDRAVTGGQDSGAESTTTGGDDASATSVTTSATSASTTTDTPTTTFTTNADTSTGVDTDPASAGFIYGSADSNDEATAETVECDIYAQDCPAGEKCMPWSNDGGGTWNATRCSPVGPNAVGEPCTVEGSFVSGVDDCELGAVCFYVDPETDQGTCVAQCGGSSDSPECADDLSCLAVENILNLCLPTCVPLDPTCAADDLCAPWQDTFFCLPDGSLDEGQHGDECTGLNTCDPGSYCTTADLVPGCTGDTCCTEYCDISMPNPDMQCIGAADGQQCIAWYEDGEAPEGYENLGACVVPT